MGVPKFFSYLQKTYKKDNFYINREDANIPNDIKNKLNNIDYLLLDANGLMHPVCFKVIADNPTVTNHRTLQNIMHGEIIKKIEELVNYAKPKQGVYIAVDGVAPVAKMRQQRFRRFKSVAERLVFDKLKKKYNKPISHEWNNSVITPGTDFMNVLHNRLLEWCKHKMEKQNFTIIYSSCNSPGEGEHKLIKFIKEKGKEFSYVIHGMDADLIFLSLATGLNNIFLLREPNELDSKDTSGALYKYISIDKLMIAIPLTMKSFINSESNDKNLIDDFIFLCYFLGNDFLPHLHAIDIAYDGIEILMKAYGESYNKYKKYLLNNNDINQEFMIYLVKMVADKEEELLITYHKNKKHWRMILSDPYERELNHIEHLKFPIDDPVKVGTDNYNSWRKRYYLHYWSIDNNEELEEFVEKLVHHYLLGLKWVTLYYFDKCPSWDWYYPFDNPPFIGDIYLYLQKLNMNSFKFTVCEPLCPYEQLLTVLPPQSKFILPKPLQKLMTDKKSSIIYLYPKIIQQDFIGKNRYYQGIPILPPMDIALVKHIYNKYKNELSDKEIQMIKKESVFIFE